MKSQFDLMEYRAALERIVNIDSNSRDPSGLNRIADFFEAEFRRIGWTVARHNLGDATGDYLEISNRRADRYDVMMIGHMDTVLPTGTAARRPFRVDGDLAYGPGVSDMKAGILAALYIAKAISSNVLDDLAICIAMNPDEEIGSVYSRAITEAIARRSDYAFVLEGTKLDGVYTVARKGSTKYEISFRGKAEHAGYILERESASAVLEMARWIQALSAMTDPATKTSVNVGVAEGGTSANVVPDRARMLVDARFPKGEGLGRIEDEIERLRREGLVPGVSVECARISYTPPMVPSEATLRYVERAKALFDRLGMPFSLIDLRGGASDGNFIAGVGTVCLDSLGPRGGGGHSENEYLFLGQVWECIERMKALIEEIAEYKRGAGRP